MYLYSDITGTYVFNQNFEIREKIEFNNLEIKELEKINEKLIKNEILESELLYLKKFINIKNLRIYNDEKLINKISEKLNNFNLYYENNLKLTKLAIKNSIYFDNIIIQTISSIEELGKIINVLTKRVREWYSYVLPELEKKINENSIFLDLITKESTDDLIKKYNINESMGKLLKKEEQKEIIDLAKTILLLIKEKEKKEKFLEDLMKENCPNLKEVAGYLIGAKLINLAGSLKNLVFLPSSTVQLLGAEKALFRHIVNKKVKPPKHGIIHEHPILQKASKENKGKVARILADKILLAAKIDYFKGSFIGDKLIKEIEEKINEKVISKK